MSLFYKCGLYRAKSMVPEHQKPTKSFYLPIHFKRLVDVRSMPKGARPRDVVRVKKFYYIVSQ